MKRSIVSLAAGAVFFFAATVLSAYPDACLTPVPSSPVPIPYACVSGGSSTKRETVASTECSTGTSSRSTAKTSSRSRSSRLSAR